MKQSNTLLSSREKLIAVFAGFFFSFLGGFLVAEYYRRSGMPEKAKTLKKFFLLGILLQFLVACAFLSFASYQNSKPQEPRALTQEELQLIDEISPKIEDYLTQEQLDSYIQQ